MNLKQLENDKSYTAKTFKGSKGFIKGNYDVAYLLALGFLMCHHESEERANDELWGIIDPEITNEATKQRVLKVLDKLIYYSIEVPCEFFSSEETAD